MVSIAARSDDPEAKGSRSTRQASVSDARSKLGEPSPMVLDGPNGSVALAIEGTEDPQELVDAIEQAGDLVWDEEESEALRQARKDAELTLSTDSVRAYLKAIGKIALLKCRTGGPARRAHRGRAVCCRAAVQGARWGREAVLAAAPGFALDRSGR